ncbi:tRNA threonylcarbamoyladenosine dehydratase, partial [Pseudoflavonifractor phocaeensis]|nr:tRNA threonylcarbamoyladenosine dehydratase [Pseudoflavonifractor phocaeensis]
GQSGEAPPPGRRSIPGSVAWVPSCAGLMMAGDIIQTLAGLRQE